MRAVCVGPSSSPRAFPGIGRSRRKLLKIDAIDVEEWPAVSRLSLAHRAATEGASARRSTLQEAEAGPRRAEGARGECRACGLARRGWARDQFIKHCYVERRVA
jgi:hypothetical protein